MNTIWRIIILIEEINFILLALFIISIINHIKVSYELVYCETFLVNKKYFPSNFLLADEEKTEDPTPKKLADAKKKGQVAKSQDLSSVIILIIVIILLTAFGDEIFYSIYDLLKYSLHTNYNMLFTKGNLIDLFSHLFIKYVKITSYMFVVIIIGGVLSNLLQSGFIKATEPLKPDIKKLNPIEGFKKIFSKKALFDFAKTFFKMLTVGFIAYDFIKDNMDKIFSVTHIGLRGVFPFFKDFVISLMTKLAVILGILAIIDFIYQKYDFKKNLRMTKHEIKEETKQMEGDPQIKSQRKQKQRDMAMNRMISEVPSSDVVITNPTHLAVAIRYDTDKDDAPKVIAKGADFIAKQIREAANESDIPIIENKPLARTLYKQVEIDEEIPMELYQAVAEILALVYEMERKKKYF
ncbi:MAG: flagellar biosynthesis protein FlhB [Firmicutes bacterium]|nr:flagellar biosynthesis protein FlhB [Bacillota bacterium]